MALRAVPDHPKFSQLQNRLRLPKYAVLGLLESLWHFTGRFTPQGNIGKYSDTAIEAWIGWQGDDGALIVALIDCGWLDKSMAHRLLVHDWQEHADRATKATLVRTKKQFVNTCVTRVRTKKQNANTDVALPVPEPVPVPVPVQEQKPSRRRAASDDGMKHSTDPRHMAFKAEIAKYWDSKNPGVAMPWGGGEGKQLGMWLREAPHITVEQFTGFLRNRFRSDVNHGERPSQWIRWITSYGQPVDRFNKPKEGSDGQEANGGRLGEDRRSASRQRVDGSRRVLARIAVERGLINPAGPDGQPSEALSLAGPGVEHRGVLQGLRTAGAEILPPESAESG